MPNTPDKTPATPPTKRIVKTFIPPLYQKGTEATTNRPKPNILKKAEKRKDGGKMGTEVIPTVRSGKFVHFAFATYILGRIFSELTIGYLSAYGMVLNVDTAIEKDYSAEQLNQITNLNSILPST
jgi:hypothetical protein